jgi:hypothetical protein
MSDRVAQIATQMRANTTTATELDRITVLRIEVLTDPDHPIDGADAGRLAEIRATLAARALVLAEIRERS